MRLQRDGDIWFENKYIYISILKTGNIYNMKTEQTKDIIPFTDDMIFSLVMRDPDICRKVAELILPDENGVAPICVAD